MKLGKLFLKGFTESLVALGRFAIFLLKLTTIVVYACAILFLGVYAVSQCGYWSLILYMIDVITVTLVIKMCIAGEFSGNAKLGIEILRSVGIVLVVTMLLGFINLLLWAVGKLVLLPFGVLLSTGAVATIGLVVALLIVFLFFFISYVKELGWRKSCEFFARLLGKYLLLAIVIGIVIYLIVV